VLGVAQEKPVPVDLRATGTVEAFASAAIKAQVSGVLQEIHFREGEEVKAGDLLFTLDPRPFTAALNQAQGALARDRAQLDNARGELQRYAAAVKKGYVSSEQAEQAATKAATLAATVKSGEAAVESARLQLMFCAITAPISGRTGEVYTAVGNLIKASADTPLVTINRVKPVKVAFAVPGKHFADIVSYRQAGTLRVEVEGAASTILPGTFSFVDNSIDAATGTLRLKAEVANDQTILWPGQTVNVRLLLTTRPQVTVVPSKAIQLGQSGPRVFVVGDDGTAEERTVVSGAPLGEETVVESGLAPGERVVLEGQLQLTSGVKVEERKPGTTGQPSQAADKRGKP
jgi:multidrug efflux system membrane fusion protein